MTETWDVHATRTAYNTVAADYAELLRNELDTKPFDRAMLGTFAELVRSSGGGTVADMVAGPDGLRRTWILSAWRPSVSTCHRRWWR